MVKYSFVVPVFNRPDEVDELLASLSRQTLTCFEVVVVEDGSEVPCEQVCQKYADRLRLHYYMKPNSGPGQSRNYGVERAQGEYVIILDSDVVLPEGYLAAVDEELRRLPADAFGGPDAAHPSFTPVQKAISYSMTSFFTTGGIRGGKKKLDKFYPRSFNMGIRRDVYQQLEGFSAMRFGEDIDFSIRIFKGGYRCRLFPEAWVWHKRRQRERAEERANLCSAQYIYDYMHPRMQDLDVEEAWVLLMNQNFKLIKAVRISRGGISETAVDVRVICREAVLCNATVVALCHNHPSNNPHPSGDDDRITQRVQKACEVMRLYFLDHLVITDGGYYSYRDYGKL